MKTLDLKFLRRTLGKYSTGVTVVTSTDNASKRFSISGFYASFFMIGIATSAPEIFISE